MGLPSDILHMKVGQMFQTPFLPSVDFAGQNIIVTDANTGIGFEAAKHLSATPTDTVLTACH
jgi:retinol dehydrogenase 12